jgi:tRNA G46 methylase TrmB
MKKIFWSLNEINSKPPEFVQNNYKKIVFDIGCGTGEVLCRIAFQNKEMFFYGIEIREDLAEMAAGRVLARKLKNVFILNIDANYLIRNNSVPSGVIDHIYIFFPTPTGIYIGEEYFKNVNNSDFFNGLNRIVKKGGLIKLISDHSDFLREFKTFIFSKDWKEVDFENPYLVPNKDYMIGSQYEYRYVFLGCKIYRVQYQKR